MSPRRAIWATALLLAGCFTMAAWMDTHVPALAEREQTGGLLKAFLSNGRKMFAKEFSTKADVYFHSGYYPSIFDQARTAAAAEPKEHMMEQHHDDAEEEEHEKAMDFLGQPKDWIDRFGRNFYSSTHSHMDKPGEAREIIPWLRISADLDPQQIDTYLVAVYWLRNMGKTDEAEQFLREGLRANPDSYELLFELGRLYNEDRKNAAHARDLWELALRRWREADAANKNPDPVVEDGILANLATVTEAQGDLAKTREYLELELKVSPAPAVIQKRIDDLKQKTAK